MGGKTREKPSGGPADWERGGNEMFRITEAIGQYFERFLRWIYPGILFLVIGHLGSTDFLKEFKLTQYTVFDFIILIFVLSFIIYILHRHIIHEAFLFLFYMIGYSAPGRLYILNYGSGQWWKRPIKYAKLEKTFLAKRFEKKDSFSDYLIFRWATTHAMGMTGEIFIGMSIWLRNREFEILGLGILGLGIFILGYCFQNWILTEVETKFIE